MGIRELHKTEDAIWAMTPREYFSLIQCAREFREMQRGDSPKRTAVLDGTIDDIKW